MDPQLRELQKAYEESPCLETRVAFARALRRGGNVDGVARVYAPLLEECVDDVLVDELLGLLDFGMELELLIGVHLKTYRLLDGKVWLYGAIFKNGQSDYGSAGCEFKFFYQPAVLSGLCGIDEDPNYGAVIDGERRYVEFPAFNLVKALSGCTFNPCPKVRVR